MLASSYIYLLILRYPEFSQYAGTIDWRRSRICDVADEATDAATAAAAAPDAATARAPYTDSKHVPIVTEPASQCPVDIVTAKCRSLGRK